MLRGGPQTTVGDRLRLAVGVAGVLAALTVLAARAPAAYDYFQSGYFASAWRTPLEREIATGDILGLNSDYQIAALSLIPGSATFAVLESRDASVAAHDYGISPTTFNALPSYFQYLLLPAREVGPAHPEYVLCYGCDTSPWDHRTHWLWTNQQGDSIGQVLDS
jgi:hypothetical protein